jgi:L-ascorbate metabolism protein UlaG (beta-lactamase superfamily)
MADASATAGSAGPARDRIAFLGHATVLIELEGTRLLTDPLLRRRVAHLRHRAPAAREQVLEGVDAVLISHLHRDHLDIASLRMLGRQTPVLVSRGAGAWLRARGFANVIELGVGESDRLGPVEVTAVEARHDDRRMPGGPRAPALGFVVRGRRQVYFAGDTELFDEMAELATGLDVALLPVAGWGPRLGPGHMDARDAARAASMLRPRLAIPVHWGTLRPIIGPRAALDHADAPHEFARHLAQLAPDVEVRILQPGEDTLL